MFEEEADGLILRALDSLEGSEAEAEEWEQLQSMIDDLGTLDRRTELETRIWEVLSYRGTALLEAHGGEFNLETLDLAATTLVESGCDEFSAREAARAALSNYLDNLSGVLNEIDSYEELDQFEEELGDAMKRWGASHMFTASRFEDRRISLEYSSRPSGGGWPSGAGRGPSISDDGIRSMFAVLK